MKAHQIKAWFKKHYGIPVRFQGTKKESGYMGVWIPSDRSDLHKLYYKHQFPAELGRAFMAIVYKGHSTLSLQTWGGNVSAHSIYASPAQWREFFASQGVSFEEEPTPIKEIAPEPSQDLRHAWAAYHRAEDRHLADCLG